MISVIMPAYNVENFIEKSIKSVLNQTYTDFELIVVNDGSTDGTKDIVKKYISIDSRVKLVNQDNRGQSDARNKGIDISKGDYIAFLDADDLYNKKFLEKMHVFVSEHSECEVAYARIEEWFMDGTKSILGPDEIINGYLEDYIFKNNEFRITSNHTMGYLYSRDLIEKYHIRFDTGYLYGEDTGFHLKLLCLTKYYGLNEVLAYYIHREDSCTTKPYNPEKSTGQVIIYDKAEDIMLAYRPQIANRFYAARNFVAYRYILRCVRFGYIEYAIKYLKIWQDRLNEFVDGDGRINDRLKCKLFLTMPKFFLPMIAKL